MNSQKLTSFILSILTFINFTQCKNDEVIRPYSFVATIDGAEIGLHDTYHSTAGSLNRTYGSAQSMDLQGTLTITLNDSLFNIINSQQKLKDKAAAAKDIINNTKFSYNKVIIYPGFNPIKNEKCFCLMEFTKPGVAITIFYDIHSDIDEDPWSSSFGMQDPSSVFTISNVEIVNEDYYGKKEIAVIAEGSFSCTIYNRNGESEAVTNGKFKLPIFSLYDIP